MSRGIRRECSSVGSDESGTGGLLGGYVVAAFRLTKKNLDKLKTFSWFSKITDSKLLSDEENIHISGEVKDKFTEGKDFVVLDVDSKYYNRMLNVNLKKSAFLCINHNLMHKQLHNEYTFHVIDNFLGSETYKYYENVPQNDEAVFIDQFLVKGELRALSIALASILARGTYLKHLNIIKQTLGIEFSDSDNHNKPSTIFEPIFKQLEEKGLSREYIYKNFCKVDQVKKYEKELKRLSNLKSTHF